MIRSVEHPPATSPASPRAAATTPAPSDGASFATALTHARSSAPPTPPSGETWQAVAGQHGFAKIVSGPRKDQYIDLARGAHHGEAFRIQTRDGKSVRVYGEAGHETVVDPKDGARRHGVARTAVDQPPKGERWAPVAGHWNYADILGGSRDGLYVNTSGNARDGRAFQIVTRGDEVLHVYGTGKDRLVIAIHKHHAPAAKPTAAVTGGTTISG